MDFATEEKLCRHAQEVWRQVAAEPGCPYACADRGASGSTDAGHEVVAALHLQDVFVLGAPDAHAW